MDALDGDLAQRAANVLASGMDIALSSHGDVGDWTKIAAAARTLTPDAERRLARREIAVETVDVESALREITRQLAA